MHKQTVRTKFKDFSVRLRGTYSYIYQSALKGLFARTAENISILGRIAGDLFEIRKQYLPSTSRNATL
jgi:hypothetical protein